MIINSALKPAAFVSAIACTIGRGSIHRIEADKLTREAIEPEGVIYLAGGYWRGVPVWGEGDTIAGLTLINPDRTAEQCKTVERGIAILLHLEVQ